MKPMYGWMALMLFCCVTTAHAGPATGTVRTVAPGVTLIPGGFEPGRQPDGNTLVWSADPRGWQQGLLVLDTGRHASHSQAILDFAAQQGSPILAVVNSHWHLDHVSGNARLRARHPRLTVYASSAIEDALRGFLARSRRQSLDYLSKTGDSAQSADIRGDVATIDSGVALLPDVSLSAPQEIDLAGHRLHLGFETHAVTAGDVWLFDPRSGVLAAGDLVTLPAPFFDTACPSRWQAALSRLAAVPFKWLVPGHGEPMTPVDFAHYRHAFDELLSCAASPAGKDVCVSKWLENSRLLLPAEQDRRLAATLLDYYFDTALRGEKTRQKELCGGLSPEAG
jgi:glyoxylase-like metal-dependent hydrolase (beta-lactamase superfamily II)